MTMKKKILTTLSVVLVLGLAALGILAYLQSEDSDVNVMTLGNVDIEQHEYQRVENADGTYKTDTIDGQNSYVLEDFEQAKPLLPIVGDPSLSGDDPGYAGWDSTTVRMSQVDSYGGMQVFAGKNAQDKFVTVKNTGKSDAYVRTLVAIEVGSTDGSLIGTSYHNTWTNTNEDPIPVEIDGNKYNVYEYVYAGGQLSDGSWRHGNGILPAGDTSYPNLSQVYLKSIATNEDMEAIDGNGNGMLDILVLSQAVQVGGFENAAVALTAGFGEANSANVAEWFSGVKPETKAADAKDMSLGLELGGTIEMSYDIQKTEADDTGKAFVNDGKTVVINGNNKKLNAGSSKDYAGIARNGATTTYNDVNVVSAGGGIGATGGSEVIFNSGSVYIDSASTSGRYVFYTEGEGTVITINGGEFSWDSTDNQKRAYIYAEAGTTVYVKGGEFGKASTRSGYTAGILGSGNVVITGGTFGFDPSTWVAEGYEAVKSGTTWTVSAK